MLPKSNQSIMMANIVRKMSTFVKNDSSSMIMINFLMIIMVILLPVTQQATIDTKKSSSSSSISDQSVVDSGSSSLSSSKSLPLIDSNGNEFDFVEPSFVDWHKRSSGFLPMRGRKSAESNQYINNNNDIIDNYASLNGYGNGIMDQSMMIQPNSEELELLNLLEKRNRINSFMPMRGRKSVDYYYNQQNPFVPPPARSNYYSSFDGFGNSDNIQLLPSQLTASKL